MSKLGRNSIGDDGSVISVDFEVPDSARISADIRAGGHLTAPPTITAME